MRIWDECLLSKTGNSIIQHETITVTQNLRDAKDIYDAYFAQYMTGMIVLKAQVQNNETHNNALQNVYAYNLKTSSNCFFKESSRIIGAEAGYQAILSAGATIDVWYIAYDDAHELIGKSPFTTHTETSQNAYTLSSDIYNDLVVPKLPQSGHYIIWTIPETVLEINQYLELMECAFFPSMTYAYNKYLRYGTNNVYGVSPNYAARLNNGATVVFVVLDYDSFGG